ncbi:hypothetical protein GCM10011611_30220 [Aliidongia dinghuensis]|uniref:Peptidase S54 rhomboid domain-containing protein n=1 Tax=Aliidongia dinghuensis TaxID=1867774 RepID=A0A8J2YVT5_9PROT|nr:rhomboid family intramembrane serine protease [Aliidongia dinghuensis]GGF22119.1 hypothetical protein GCM10011611_30220 [Aliidongia dinghuensis]
MIETDQSFQSIPFRLPPVWPPNLLSLLGGVVIGAFFAVSAMSESWPRGWDVPASLGIALAAITVLMLGRQAYHRAKGGPPPISFERDGLSVPRNVNSHRSLKIPYADVLSAVIVGRGRRASVILDTRRRTYVFPVREFAEADAVPRLVRLVSEHVSRQSDGAVLVARMAAREAVAVQFGRARPRATRSLVGFLVLVFLGQSLWLSQADPLGMLDLGANASSLVVQGEWFRLITANLLHANALHLLSNGFFALVVGTIVERQLGIRRFMILVLATGIVSQGASALAAELGWLSSNLMSVGFSGVLFGMLGAQAVLNRRFGAQLPGGYRFAPRVWWILLGVNFVLLPLVIPALDVSAHVGGLLSGIAVGWLLVRGQGDITRLPPRSLAGSGVLAALGIVWLAGITLAIVHSADTAARRADRALLTKAIAARTHTPPDIDNDLAWLVAISATPTPDELADAEIMARRALGRTIQTEGTASGNSVRITDTLATVLYRRGDVAGAIATERPVAKRDALFASQQARFMAAAVAQQGGRPLGNPAPLPTVTLEPVEAAAPSVGIALQLAEPVPLGAAFTAVLEQDGKPRAVLQIDFPAGARQSDHVNLRLTPASKLTSADLQDATVRVLQFDTSGCACTAKRTYVRLFPYAPRVAGLP